MTIGFPSLRVERANPLHHLWCNNGTWWVHYTLHFDDRKRRIRRSLGTPILTVAIERRDELLGRLAREGEVVPERRLVRGMNKTITSIAILAGSPTADRQRLRPNPAQESWKHRDLQTHQGRKGVSGERPFAV